jgi:hypothetical protein
MGVLLAGGMPCTFTLLTTLDMVIVSESTRLMCATPGTVVVGLCGGWLRWAALSLGSCGGCSAAGDVDWRCLLGKRATSQVGSAAIVDTNNA